LKKKTKRAAYTVRDFLDLDAVDGDESGEDGEDGEEGV
jgi:hypothetical protein